MALNPGLLADEAQFLLDCACRALVKNGVLPEECCDPDSDSFRAFVAQGEVAWDGCCTPCGQLSVRLVRIFESDTLPSQAIGPSQCGHRQLVAEWEILWIRCVTVAENAEAQPPILPFPGTITLEAREILTALWSMWAEARCCFLERKRDDPGGLFDAWMSDGSLAGPQGGCAGASITVESVVGPACDCRDAVPAPIA